jgi:hypothetical protein
MSSDSKYQKRCIRFVHNFGLCMKEVLFCEIIPLPNLHLLNLKNARLITRVLQSIKQLLCRHSTGHQDWTRLFCRRGGDCVLGSMNQSMCGQNSKMQSRVRVRPFCLPAMNQSAIRRRLLETGGRGGKRRTLLRWAPLVARHTFWLEPEQFCRFRNEFRTGSETEQFYVCLSGFQPLAMPISFGWLVEHHVCCMTDRHYVANWPFY